MSVHATHTHGSGDGSAACPRCRNSELIPLPDSTWRCAQCDTRLHLVPVLDDRARTLVMSNHDSDGDLPHFTPTGSHSLDPAAGLSDATGDRRYEIGDEIGRGGMGSIRHARDRDIGRHVAMKVLLDNSDAAQRLRFIEEAQVTGQLEHPNIVPIHSLGIDRASGDLFIAMKLVEGHTLEEIIDAKRAGDEREEWALWRLLQIFIGACNGVGFAHSRGVVHRDLKPANIMSASYGQVLVMDWGLAKVGASREENRDPAVKTRWISDKQRSITTTSTRSPTTSAVRSIRSESEDDNRLTVYGDVVGTLLYMPPEQAAGRINEVDERADIYSLGAILYEILALEPAIDDGKPNKVIERVLAGDIPPPEQRAPERNIPRELSAIAMKALEYHRHDRYQSVRELRRDIYRFLDNRAVSAKDDTGLEALIKLIRRNQVPAMITIAALLVLSTITVVGYQINLAARHEAEQTLAALQSEQQKRAQVESDKQRIEQAREAEVRRDWQMQLDERFNADFLHHWQLRSGWDSIIEVPAHALNDYAVRTATGLRVSGEPNVQLALREDIGRDARVILDASYHDGRDGGMHIVLNGNAWNRGYCFQLGGFDNSRAFILRGTGDNGNQTELAAKPYTLQSGQRYQVMATAVHSDDGVSLELHVNNQLLLITHDPDPLSHSSAGAVAVYTAGPANTVWHRVRVLGLGEPQLTDLLAAANRHLQRGNYATARDLFNDVAESSAQPSRIEQALRGSDEAQRMLDLSDRLPVVREQLAASWPKATIDLNLSGDGLELQLSGEDITTLEPIARLALYSLELANCRLTTLAPLSGMPLQHVSIRNCADIRDINPLAGAPITSLELALPRLKDIDACRNMPLNELRLSCPRVTDLSPVAGKALSILKLDQVMISDLEAMRGAPLQTVSLSQAPITDLAPIVNPALRSLSCTDCGQLTSMPELNALELTLLDFRNCPIASLVPLAGASIQRIVLMHTQVTDLTPLSGSGATSIVLSHSPVSDLQPLAALPLLTLDISGTAVSELAPLADMPLNEVLFRDTAVSELAPLANAPLRTLDIRGSAVVDLSPISGSSIQILELGSCPVTLDLLEAQRLHTIAFDERMLTLHRPALANFPRLSSIMLRDADHVQWHGSPEQLADYDG